MSVGNTGCVYGGNVGYVGDDDVQCSVSMDVRYGL